MPEIEDNSDAAGGSTITSYNLEWLKIGQSEYEDLVGGSGDNLNRLITTATIPGASY